MTKGQFLIGGIIATGFIVLTCLVIYTFYFGGIEALKEQLGWIITAWTVNFTTLVNWFFGSSKGSSDKSEIMRNMKPIKPPEC